MLRNLGTADRAPAGRLALSRTIRQVAPTAGLVSSFCFCFAGLIYLAQDLRTAALTDIAAHRLTVTAFVGAQVTFLLSIICGLLLIGAVPASVLAWRYTVLFYRQALANEIAERTHG